MSKHTITQATSAMWSHVEHGIEKHGNFGSEVTGCSALQDRWDKLLSAMKSHSDMNQLEKATRRALQLAALCMKYVSEFGCEVLPVWHDVKPVDAVTKPEETVASDQKPADPITAD